MDYLEIVSYERQSKDCTKVILKINRGNDELLFRVEHPYVPSAAKYYTCYVENIGFDKQVYAIGEKYKEHFCSGYIYSDQNHRILADIGKVVNPFIRKIRQF
jgi:hypothetical protein